MKLLTLALLLSVADVLSFAPPTKLPQQKKMQLALAKKKYPSPSNEWLKDDMKKASKAENESKDWVAERMNEAGHAGKDTDFHNKDWIEKDMQKAGEDTGEQTHTPVLRKKVKKETKEDKLAKRMAEAGRRGSSKDRDWVKRDMMDAGKPDSRSAEKSTWQGNKLGRALDDAHDKSYDDIAEDMEKAGKLGSEKTRRIAEDMKRAGMAGSPMEKLQAAFHEVSYNLNEWQKKAFDIEQIEKDMMEAGMAKDDSVTAHNMEITGRVGSPKARVTPTQIKELRDDIREREGDQSWIAKDMTESGKGGAGWFSRKDHVLSEKRREKLVKEDMEKASKTTGDWVQSDMERIGNPEWRSLSGPANTSTNKKRETEGFMKMRPVKMAPTPEVIEPEEQEVEEVESVLQEVEPVLQKVHPVLEDVEQVYGMGYRGDPEAFNEPDKPDESKHKKSVLRLGILEDPEPSNEPDKPDELKHKKGFIRRWLNF